MAELIRKAGERTGETGPANACRLLIRLLLARRIVDKEDAGDVAEGSGDDLVRLAQEALGDVEAWELCELLHREMRRGDEPLGSDVEAFDDVEQLACAVKLLVDMGERRDVESLVKLARRARESRRAEVRWAAACVLAVSGLAEDEEVLWALEVLMDVPEVLGEKGYGALGPLIGLWHRARRAEVRERVRSQVNDVLVRAQEEAPGRRLVANEAWSTPDYRNSDLAAVVGSALRSEDIGARAAAAGVWPFVRVPGTSVTPILDLLGDDSPEVRASALRGLQCSGALPQEALARVVDLLRDPSLEVQHEAARQLEAVKNLEVRDWLAGECAAVLAQDGDNLSAFGVLSALVSSS